MRAHLIVLLALAQAAPAFAQQPVSGPAGPFAESIDVNVVNIEVFVTDKRGQHIEGLTRDDFELVVDGKPLPITHFYTVRGDRPIHAPPPATSTERDSRLVSTPASGDRPDDQRLHLVVYVDHFNLRPFNRNRALAAIRTFLSSRWRPGDEVMLVSYDRSLRLRHPFTSDPRRIADALGGLEEESGQRTIYDAERREMLDLIADAATLNQVRGRAVQHVQSIHNDLRFTLDSLREHVESLAGLPGRKAILYVSDGLPLRSGADVYEALAGRFPDDSSIRSDVFRFDLSRDYESLIRRANAHRVTFYTLDAVGLRSYTYFNAESGSLSGSANIDQVHFDNLQQPLRLLAAETGGLAILGTNDFRTPLDRIADDFDSYYSLGFSPAGDVLGRYHEIQVRLRDRRKGVLVRHREGYRDKAPTTAMTEKVLAALTYGAASNSLGVELTGGHTVAEGEGRYHVAFEVEVPIGQLALLPQQELHRGRIRLFVGVQDSNGDRAPIHQQVEAIDVPSHQLASARTQLYRVPITLLMEGGRHLVAVGVRDELGATGGVAITAVDVGALPEKTAARAFQ